jgi:hypothetical protein
MLPEYWRSQYHHLVWKILLLGISPKQGSFQSDQLTMLNGRHNPNAMDIGDSQHKKLWKRLWSLNVPAKIKIFGWRVLHGLIPCLGVLANRHIAQSSSA